MIKKIIFIFIILFFFNYSYAQNNDVIKTTTFYNNSEARKISYYTSNYVLLKEEHYLVSSNSKVADIEFNPNGKIVKLNGYSKNKQIFKFDFLAGVYDDWTTETQLRFKGNFIFNGIQKSKNISCYYKEGKREGVYIQYDSAVSGKKLVNVQRPNIALLQYNVIKYDKHLQEEDTYQKYQSIKLNFSGDKLNGIQQGYYFGNSTKFISEYNVGALMKYTSYEKDRSIVSKISTISGVINSPYFFKGDLINDDIPKIAIIPELINVGRIINSDNKLLHESRKYKNDEDEMPEREDLQEIKITFAGEEENDLLDFILDNNKIPRLSILPYQTPSNLENRILFKNLKKVTTKTFEFCKPEYILDNSESLQEEEISNELISYIGKVYSDNFQSRININPNSASTFQYEFEKNMNLMDKIYNQNNILILSQSERYDWINDTTRAYVEYSVEYKTVYDYLNKLSTNSVCFNKGNLSFTGRKTSFEVVNKNSTITTFNFTLIPDRPSFLNMEINQVQLPTNTKNFEFIKLIKL